jgi:predicted O-linked N-acetylglucosamine transferase (SPINDLY family)
MTTLSPPLTRAYEHFRARRFAEARDLFCAGLEAHPDHADAWHILGLIAHESGEHALACRCIEKALSLDAFNAVYHTNLGEVYRKAGRRDEAVASCRHALALRPELAGAHGNLGVALEERGDLDAALAAYREAARLQPDSARWLTNIGNVLRVTGRGADALRSYRDAIRRQPDCADAHHQLALILAEQGDLKKAESACQEALRLRPDFAPTYNNLGNIWKAQDRFEEAVRAYQQALSIDPEYAQAFLNLGDALQRLGCGGEAIAAFREAGRLQPNSAEPHLRLGSIFLRQQRLGEAETCLREVLRLAPGCLGAANDLGCTLMLQGRIREASETYRDILRRDPRHHVAHSSLLFHLNYDPELAPACLVEEHARWARVHAPRIVAAPHTNDPDPERPLRVGYASPDLRWHAVCRFFEPILANHDPRRAEAHCYAEVPVPDAVTQRLRGLAQGWHFTCGLSDAQLAEQIRADQIDILVDLAGHTAGSRLLAFARRPAPVQVAYLGYPNTTGLRAIDYRLTDAVADPPGAQRQYVEELVYLNEGLCCFGLAADAPDVAPLPALRNGHITFASPHNLAKLNGRVLDLWARVLEAVPNSRLFVFRSGLDGAVRDRLAGELTRRGIGPERLELRDVVLGDLRERGYLALYSQADILLDAFPAGAHTTACEALGMGVPVLTLYGDRTWGRISASVLTRLGLSDWVARTPEEYVENAARQAADLPALAALRGGLRGRLMAGLGDGPRFTRALEDAYRALWRRWCDKHTH